MSPELAMNCEKAVHVVKSDGEILRAGQAVLFMLGEIGYCLLVTILRLPPFIWGVELLYKFVASNRPWLAHIMFRKEYAD